jgi:hypothetical protein
LLNIFEKSPSFHQTDSLSNRTHKSDSLPNFGVNQRLGDATRGAHGQESHGGEMIVLEENRARGEHAAT